MFTAVFNMIAEPTETTKSGSLPTSCQSFAPVLLSLKIQLLVHEGLDDDGDKYFGSLLKSRQLKDNYTFVKMNKRIHKAGLMKSAAYQ